MKKLQQIDRRLLTILLIVFVQILGAAMILPILPLYAQREFALPPQSITLLVSAFFAAQFLAGPYLGRLSDKHGRLPILIISQIGTALSFLMLALAPNAAFLYLARILDGVTGGNIIVAQAYVTDVTPRERRTESLGYIFAVFGLGFIFGPALGGVLSAAFGPRLPYVIAAVAAALTVLLTWATLDETLTPEQRAANRSYGRRRVHRAGLLRNRVLLLVLLIAFVGQFGMGMLQSTFALFGAAVLFAGRSEALTSLGIGLLLANVGLGQFLTQAFVLRRAVRRLGEARLIVLGVSLRTLTFFVLALTVAPAVAAVGTLFFALGQGVMMPSLQSVATTTVADEMRGGVLGFYQSAISLATIFSTAVAGVLFALDPAVPYWLAGGLGLLLLPPALLLTREKHAPPKPSVT